MTPDGRSGRRCLSRSSDEVLGPDALRIEHIGSTAHPSMNANDILGVQVSVPDLDVAVERFGQPPHALYERAVAAAAPDVAWYSDQLRPHPQAARPARSATSP